MTFLIMSCTVLRAQTPDSVALHKISMRVDAGYMPRLGSWMPGAKANVMVMYPFNRYFGMEAGMMLGYLADHSSTTLFNGDMQNTYRVRGNYGAFLLGGTFRYENKSRFTPYLRVGASLMLWNNYTENWSNQYGMTGPTSFQYRTQVGPSLGFYVAGGCSYRLTKRISVFVEFNSVWNMFTPFLKRTLTGYSENGQDKLSTLSVNQREAIYRRHPQQQNDPNKPGQFNWSTNDFNGRGILLGLRIDLR